MEAITADLSKSASTIAYLVQDLDELVRKPNLMNEFLVSRRSGTELTTAVHSTDRGAFRVYQNL